MVAVNNRVQEHTRGCSTSPLLCKPGFKPSIRRKRYGLQPGDLVEWDGKECVVNGVFNKGRWVRLMTLVGETLNCNIEKVRLIVYGKGVFKRC